MDNNLMLDSAVLQTALKIFKSQALSLKGVASVLFLIRLVYLYAKLSPVGEYSIAVRDLCLCMFLLYNFEGILNVLVLIPSHANELHPISQKEVFVSQTSIFGTTINHIVEWILSASYWIAVSIYIVLMFLLLIVGPFVFMIGTLVPSYGLIKFYFSVLVIISLWPLAWFAINIVTQGIIDSISMLKDGIANGIVLLLSGIIKALAPIVLLLAKNAAASKISAVVGSLKSGFKPIGKVANASTGVARSAIKNDFVSNLRGKNIEYDSFGMPSHRSQNSIMGRAGGNLRNGLKFAGSSGKNLAGSGFGKLKNTSASISNNISKKMNETKSKLGSGINSIISSSKTDTSPSSTSTQSFAGSKPIDSSSVNKKPANNSFNQSGKYNLKNSQNRLTPSSKITVSNKLQTFRNSISNLKPQTSGITKVTSTAGSNVNSIQRSDKVNNLKQNLPANEKIKSASSIKTYVDIKKQNSEVHI